MMRMFKILFVSSECVLPNEWMNSFRIIFSFFFLGKCLKELIFCFHTNTVASNNLLNSNKEKVENDFHSTVTLLTKFEHVSVKIAQIYGLFYRILNTPLKHKHGGITIKHVMFTSLTSAVYYSKIIWETSFDYIHISVFANYFFHFITTLLALTI